MPWASYASFHLSDYQRDVVTMLCLDRDLFSKYLSLKEKIGPASIHKSSWPACAHNTLTPIDADGFVVVPGM